MTTESNKDNLEHNDGLGDLLRERERLEFSWIKTSIVLVCLLSIIAVSIIVIFKFGKQSIEKSIVKTKANQVHETIAKTDTTPNDNTTQITNSSTKSVKTHPQTKITQKTKPPIKSSPKQKSLNKKVAPTNSYKVITGTFKKKQYAKNFVKKLKQKGIDSYIKLPYVSKTGNTLYQVQSGSFKTKSQAEKHKSNLKKKKIDAYIIKK